MRRSSGFTLIELLAVMFVTTVLLTLGAGAIRHYWLLHSLENAGEQVVSELRGLQARVVSESHPLVFGAWFKSGASASSATTQWGVVRYDPKDASTSLDDECVQAGSPQVFGTDVYVSQTDFETLNPITQTCAAAVPSGAEIVLFFARGSATSGSVTLTQDLVGRSTEVSVSPQTGRVTRQ